MELDIKGENILILGASSGFGRAVAEQIASEGAHPVLVARSDEKLKEFHKAHPDSTVIAADLFTEEGLQKVIDDTSNINLSGVLMNAGGPSGGSFPLNDISDWDRGYEVVLRWKIKLLMALMPRFEENGSGRVVFIESVSVREPIDGLVLSNVYRMAVVGLMKSLVNTMDGKNILMNVLAPGYHRTDRLNNLIRAQSTSEGKTEVQISAEFAANTPLKKLGDPADLARLAVFLLSPRNSYVTGQIITVDGGLTKGI